MSCNQTHRDFRITVVDDCYPDDAPRRWLESLADDRVGISAQRHQSGRQRQFPAVRQAGHRGVFRGDGVRRRDAFGLSGQGGGVGGHVSAGGGDRAGVQIIDDAGAVVRPLGDRVKHRLAPREASVLSGQDLAVSLLHGNWTYFPSLLWRTEAVREVGEQGFRQGWTSCSISRCCSI